MARVKDQGNGRLEEAMANLLQSQAILVQNQAAFLARAAEMDQRFAESQRDWVESQRNIKEQFSRIEAILLEHNRILQALPDAIRDKIGFKAPGQT
jgi:hypothetical protein